MKHDNQMYCTRRLYPPPPVINVAPLARKTSSETISAAAQLTSLTNPWDRRKRNTKALGTTLFSKLNAISTGCLARNRESQPNWLTQNSIMAPIFLSDASMHHGFLINVETTTSSDQPHFLYNSTFLSHNVFLTSLARSATKNNVLLGLKPNSLTSSTAVSKVEAVATSEEAQ
ncbi:hypothetical protein CR513_44823, partial [Mucuna pruriens]